MHPNPRTFAQQPRRVQRHARNSDAYSFFNLLTGPELFEKVESLLPKHRERLFAPTETLSIFLAQALSTDRSCQKAVNEAAVRRVAAGLGACSTHTGAYCRARARLPVEMVCTLARYTGQWITAHAPQPWCWRGRPVRLVDGTTVVMPDTPANQAQYPQSRSQKPGLGFPLCRLVGMMCLGSGAVLDAAMGPYRGKGGDERSLLRSILDTLKRGDLLLGDAYFATYFLLCTLVARGIDAVFEQNGARQLTTDFRRGQRLGQRDHLIVLKKPILKPDWMSQADYDQAAELPEPRDGNQGDLGLLARLQPHSADDGSSGTTCRVPAASTQLQAHRTALDRMGSSPHRERRRHAPDTIRVDRPATCRRSPWTHRAQGRQATTKTLPAAHQTT